MASTDNWGYVKHAMTGITRDRWWIVWVFLLATTLTLGQATAQEWVQIKEHPSSGEMNKGAKGVRYNERNYKFYKVSRFKLQADQLLSISVESYDYQPKIIVLGKDKKKLQTSVHAKPNPVSDGRILYRTALEFVPPDRGTYYIMNTTEEIDQGHYRARVSLFEAPKTALACPDTMSTGQLITDYGANEVKCRKDAGIPNARCSFRCDYSFREQNKVTKVSVMWREAAPKKLGKQYCTGEVRDKPGKYKRYNDTNVMLTSDSMFFDSATEQQMESLRVKLALIASRRAVPCP